MDLNDPPFETKNDNFVYSYSKRILLVIPEDADKGKFTLFYQRHIKILMLHLELTYFQWFL